MLRLEGVTPALEDLFSNMTPSLSRLETLRLWNSSLSASTFWTLPFSAPLRKLVLSR